MIGGAGSEVERVLAEIASPARLLRLGIPDHFIEHGDQTLLLASIGLDPDGIIAAIRARPNLAADAEQQMDPSSE